MGSTEKVVKQCSWCHPAGSKYHNPKASHGICLDCLKEHYSDCYQNMVDAIADDAKAAGIKPEMYLKDSIGGGHDSAI
jgi:hypothetical protein